MNETVYDTKIRPELERIEEYAKLGYNNRRIATAIGVSYTTLLSESKKHDELKSALVRGRQNGCTAVRKSLLKLALGYTYEESKTYVKMQNGEKITYKEVINKTQAPNIGAIQTYLRLYDDDYRDVDLESSDIRKAELKLKKSRYEDEKQVW